jgi:hypothetical protein
MDIGPVDGQFSFSGGEAIRSIRDCNDGIAFERLRGQKDFAGCSHRGQRRGEQQQSDTIAHHGASISD